MRRLVPLWSSLLAVLLLMQWAGGAAACLPRLQAPAMVLCIAGDGGTDHAPAPDHQAAMGCPLCAPLPPAVLAGPPAPPPPHPVTTLAAAAMAPSMPASATAPPGPQQPRAPPAQA